VKSNPDNKYFDPFEVFLGLKSVIHDSINMVDEFGNIIEFKQYKDVVDKWFVIRKQLYKKRIERLLLLSKLKIKYLNNIIRFTQERQQYNISYKTSEKEFYKILENNNYDKFNESILKNPKYLKFEQLESNILNGDYNYLIDLKFRDLLDKACEKRKTDLLNEIKICKELENDCIENETQFIGQKTWLKEIEKLEKIIVNGIEKGWTYDEDKYVKFVN
jgi:hypothetical protein